ncbi:MAG: ATP-grasp domain-containing protein, partial [Thermomicrobiales bacterium]
MTTATDGKQDAIRRVMLLMSPATYRAAAFFEAARGLGIETVSVVDMPDHLQEYWGQSHGVDFSDTAQATTSIVELARRDRVDALLSVDDSATELAALAGSQLGVPHNSPEAAVAARDKFRMRSMLAAGGVRCPGFRRFNAAADPATYAGEVSYPCVVKPTRLSGSRGVIRANDAVELIAAVQRLQTILRSDGNDLATTEILIEDYLPGEEVAVEGLLTDGELHVLTIFDKPDPLVGPFFEETIYTAPSRLPPAVQDAIARETAACAAALGLRTGPVHAELRVNETGPWILEIAGRSIGGLCSTVLSFGAGMCLEELILRHAVGMEIPSYDRSGNAAGVMMIPIPKAGILRSVTGVEHALEAPGIDGIEITAKMNYPIKPLPEGASYLGFIFARADTPEEVEVALREAHARL